MDPERHDPETTHEFRLEGIGLLFGGGLLLAAIVGAFLLGRWYERRSQPPATPGASDLGALEQVAEPLPDSAAEQGLTFFDEVEGGGKQPEPERQAARPETAPAATQTAEPPAPAGPDRPYWVQVFAGRDRRAAEQLVASLTREGHGVRLLSDREAGGALYKVQVGGYGTENEARAAAKQLEQAGYSVWVPPVD